MKPINIAILAICFATGSVNASTFSFTGNFSDDHEVQPFYFSVAEPATVGLSTFSQDSGVNSESMFIKGGGFYPVVTLWNTDGTNVLITSSLGNMGAGLTMDPGNYIAALTQANSLPVLPLLSDGFSGHTPQDFGGRDSHWAFDISNVSSASAGIPYISAVPEPETYAMFLAGLALLGWRMRRFKK